MLIPWFMHCHNGVNTLTGIYGTPVGTYVRSYADEVVEVTFYPHDHSFIAGNTRTVIGLGKFPHSADREDQIDRAVAGDLIARQHAVDHSNQPNQTVSMELPEPAELRGVDLAVGDVIKVWLGQGDAYHVITRITEYDGPLKYLFKGGARILNFATSKLGMTVENDAVFTCVARIPSYA